MALNLYTTYPGNVATGDETNYPVGKARNETADGLKDWFPLEATWINELLGFLGAILTAAGYTPDGNAEVAGSSQYLNGLRSLDVPVSRLSQGYSTIDSAGLFFGTAALGRANFNGYPGQSASFETIAPNSKTNVHNLALEAGYLRVKDSVGIDFKTVPVMVSLSVGDISFNTGVPVPYLGIAGKVLTGINFGNVWKTELIMRSATNVLTVPIIGDYYNSSGTLGLATGYCTWPSGVVIAPGDYTSFYLQIWVDPATIS